jgi:NitT/TauT family transport system substrate-binding protein
MSKHTIAIMGSILAIVAVILLSAVLFQNIPVQPKGPPEPLTIGMNPQEYSSLIFIGQDRGYFASHGLNVTIRNYGSGAVALAGLERGETDFALCAEFPVVSAAFRKEPVSAIANIDRYQSGYLIGRADLGVRTMPDLAGKSIGVEKGTLGEFRLSRFITLNGLEFQNVRMVNIPLTQSLDALANGSVDAVVILGNDLDPAKKRLGNSLSAWRVDNRQQGYSLIVGKNDWLSDHPDEVRRFLLSLNEAEDFVASHPAEARVIVQRRLNYPDAYMEKIWPDHDFALTLDQSLLLAMEDEARWMDRNNLTGTRAIPNFLDYLRTDGLKSIKPGSVNIIGI